MRQSEFFKEYGELIIMAIEPVLDDIGSNKKLTKDYKDIIKVIKEKLVDLRIIELEDKVVADNWEQIYDSFSEAEREEYDKLVYEGE